MKSAELGFFHAVLLSSCNRDVSAVGPVTNCCSVWSDGKRFVFERSEKPHLRKEFERNVPTCRPFRNLDVYRRGSRRQTDEIQFVAQVFVETRVPVEMVGFNVGEYRMITFKPAFALSLGKFLQH